MPRRPLIAGNWKMHKTIAEAVDTARKIASELTTLSNREALICPPFTSLSAVADALKGSAVKAGAQNMNDNLQGAFTGEVSPAMVKDTGATHVILGHSERRQYYGETDALILKKTKLALEQGLTPVVCVGETLQERESGRTTQVIETQLKGGLGALSAEQAGKIVIAYEPVWAIGTGRTATTDQAQEVHAFIRTWMASTWGKETADAVRVLYGGSVKPDNIDALMSQPDIDGGLVGGASLKAEDFLRLVRFQAAAKV